MELQPDGRGELAEPIPLDRTTAPYDIPETIDELSATTGKLDARKLAASFQTMSDTMRGAPQHMSQAVDGLAKLSEAVAKRDQQLAELVRNASDVSGIVASRDQEGDKMIKDGNLPLSEVQARKQAISGLLEGTQAVAQQLRGMVADNQEQIGPALQQLDQLTAMLQRNQDNLNNAIGALAPYVRGFNNTIANGRWFEGYFCGLLPPPMRVGPVHTNSPGCSLPAQSGGAR